MYKLKRILVLIIVLFSTSCSLFGKPTNVIYLIPNGYTGGVIILYNQPDGIIPEITDDGTVIYRIPNDGFLKVKSPLKREGYKFSYYFVDANDTRIPIEYVYPEAYVRNPGDVTSKSKDSITEDERVNGIFIMNHRNISFNLSGERIQLNSFSVGHPKDSRSIYIDTDGRVDKIQIELSKSKSNSKTANE